MDKERCLASIPHIVHGELLAANGCEPVRQIQGGMSGATVWECTNAARVSTCLRGWPASHPTRERLTEIHQHLQLLTEANVNFTPELHYSRHGSSITFDGQRLWELTSWLPGHANYCSAPNHAKLVQAMQAIAKVHQVWCASSEKSSGITAKVGSPTLVDRAKRLDAWHHRMGERTRLVRQTADTVERQLVSDTFELLNAWAAPLKKGLQRLADDRVAHHFVLRDIWSEHLLFTEDQVTGIIDFGACRFDEPTTDLVRLLGSIEPHHEDRRREGLEIYNRCRRTLGNNSTCANSAFEELSWERFEILDQTATLLSALQWLEWLIIDERPFEQPRWQLLDRWRAFVNRLRC